MPQRTNQDYCFHRKISNHLLPTQPVFTHWCKPFKAVEYYIGSYEVNAKNVQEFSGIDDAACVGLVRETVTDANVKRCVAYIA
jgi:hypothetical protein